MARALPEAEGVGGVVTCVRCGAEGRQVLHPLKLVACDPCMSAWLADDDCSMSAVCKALGFSENPLKPRDLKAFDAELDKRTRAWAKKGAS